MPKHPEVSPKRVTKRRLQVEHRFGAYWDHAADNLVSQQVDRRSEKEGIRRLFGEGEEETSSRCNLEELDSELSNVVLCEEKGADCVISTPILWK